MEELTKRPSVLSRVVNLVAEMDNIDASAKMRLEITQRLKALDINASKGRATFILNQDAINFNANREAWGITDFLEALIVIDDFKNGFLWRFRAHTTS